MARSVGLSYLLHAALSLCVGSTLQAFEWPWNSTAAPIVEAPPPQAPTLLAANPSSASPGALASAPDCSIKGDYVVADWLNAVNVGSFFSLSDRYILNHDSCFVFFNLPERLSLWLEPFCFYSRYRSQLKHKQEMNFTLLSYGSSAGAKWSINNFWDLGAQVGYFHSNLHDKSAHKKGSINGIYFGPAVRHLFSDGSAGLSLFGVKNYHEASNWSIDLRVEGEYDYALPARFHISDFLIHPFARIDYVNVVAKSSFFYSKLGVRFDKAVYCTERGSLSANVDIGWINMTPLSSNSVKCEGASFNMRPCSKNQLALGIDLAFMGQNGVLIALEYDAALGSHAPQQTARTRVEWNW